MKSALETALGEGTMVLCHISHVYATGCSLYFTVAAAGGGEERLERWLKAKAAANDAIVASGASITHHHAVGTDHRGWLTPEIGDGRCRRAPCGEGASSTLPGSSTREY